MNKNTAFRDLWFFTLVLGTLSILLLDKYKSSFLKKSKTIYLFSFIYSIAFLVLIYLIYIIEGAEDYANGTFTDKWEMSAGFILFISILLIKLFSHERKD